MEFETKFQNLLNRTIDIPQIKAGYISVEPEDKEPNLEEIEVVIKMLKNNKAAGNDEIASALFKYGGDNLKIEIWNLIKEVWMIERMPENLNTSIIYPIKKRDMQRTVVVKGGCHCYLRLIKFSQTLFLTAYNHIQ